MALVVGNGAYGFSPLANPVNDARLMERSLRETGFDVTAVTDVGRREMKSAIADFGERLRRSGPDTVALFYFAGHGVQIDGRNFLIPTDAEVNSAADVEYVSIDAQWVLDLIGESRAGLSVIILDACRNNPFRSISRSARQGLARMDAPRGSMLAFSTGPGEVALDGEGSNSPYTQALATEMLKPGLKIEEMFKNVRRSVLSSTRDQQVPWETSSLTGDFFFSGGASDAPSTQVIYTPAPAADSVGAGEVFTDCPDCPEMVAIPSGTFSMGQAGGDYGNGSVVVNVDGFAMATREVTIGEFRQFMRESGHVWEGGCWHWWLVWGHDNDRTWETPGYATEDSHPVVCNRYSDSVAYAQWLSRKTGKRYRLPSEAEWEYAAGAGNGAAPWGTNPDLACVDANIHDRSGTKDGIPTTAAGCEDGYTYMAPAGTYGPNAFGLYDMIGNAAEFVADCFNGSHQGRPTNATARTTGDCNTRIYKGSHMLNWKHSFLPQFRQAGVGEWPNIYGGFRVARDLN